MKGPIGCITLCAMLSVECTMMLVNNVVTGNSLTWAYCRVETPKPISSRCVTIIDCSVANAVWRLVGWLVNLVGTWYNLFQLMVERGMCMKHADLCKYSRSSWSPE